MDTTLPGVADVGHTGLVRKHADHVGMTVMRPGWGSRRTRSSPLLRPTRWDLVERWSVDRRVHVGPDLRLVQSDVVDPNLIDASSEVVAGPV